MNGNVYAETVPVTLATSAEVWTRSAIDPPACTIAGDAESVMMRGPRAVAVGDGRVAVAGPAAAALASGTGAEVVASTTGCAT